MITSLAIKNFALIEDLQVDLNSGLTAITGETGAGKSIILGALALILGRRANLESVKDNTKKCVIEAHFDLAAYHLKDLFEENHLDYDDHSILRREILPGGKSRAFVNDAPATLAQVQALAPYLIDVHSQHETMDLVSEEFQLEVVDALADNADLLGSYAQTLREYKKRQKELHLGIVKKEEQSKELDYNLFLLNELKEAHLDKINQEELETLFNTLNNAEQIQEAFSEALQRLEASEMGVLESAKNIRNILNRIQSYSPSYTEYWERFNSVIIELEDLTEELNTTSDRIAAEPALLVEVNEKLQKLYRLQQKHNLETVDELLALQEELEFKVNDTLDMDEQLKKLKKKLDAITQDLKTQGKAIHTRRKEVLPKLKAELEAILATVGLPNAIFEMQLEFLDSFKLNGMDALAMLFSANKGMPAGPIKKVASGGERSRIMLAIKAVIAKYKNLPTLIFDEIDTGVSGEVANKMGDIMLEMSRQMQVLTITHLPQIAAKGKHHLKVYKNDNKEVTTTHLKTLLGEERVLEIAEMLGGKKITDAARANAQELLN